MTTILACLATTTALLLLLWHTGWIFEVLGRIPGADVRERK